MKEKQNSQYDNVLCEDDDDNMISSLNHQINGLVTANDLQNHSDDEIEIRRGLESEVPRLDMAD